MAENDANDRTDEAPEEPGTDTPGPPASWLGRGRAWLGRRRQWIAAHRLKALLLALGGTTLLGCGVLLGVYFLAVRPSEPTVTAETALAALDQGEYAEARRQAEVLRDYGALPDEQVAVPSFVLGAAAAQEAEKLRGADRGNRFLVAAAHLEEARGKGLPADRLPEGTFLLGKSLLGGGQAAASRPVLRDALRLDPQRAGEIHYLLAAASLRDGRAGLPEALKHNELLLADPSLPASPRRRGLLQRIEILLATGKVEEARQVLAKLPPGPPGSVEAAVLAARILVQEARALKTPGADAKRQAEAGRKYREALQTLRQAKVPEGLLGVAAEKVAFLTGVCLLETGDPRGALGEFTRTRATWPGTPEAAAADFHEAELLRQMNRDGEAVAAYRRALRSVADPQSYDNPWLPAESMRNRTLEAYQQYLDARNWAACLGLAQAMSPLFPRARMVQAQAEADTAWGHDLLAQADHVGPPKAEGLSREGRFHLRRAGTAYERLAASRVATRDYPEDLWKSANAYLEGHDYRNAARTFQQFLKVESRLHHASALAGLGESLLALDRLDEAIAALERCATEDPRDVSSFRARVLAARARIEKGDLKLAEQRLEENLNSDSLTPAGKEWRESLFLLGEVLHKSGQYAEAIARLEEAVARDADSRWALGARYLVADCYHQSAKAEAEKLKHDVAEQSRAARAKRIRDLLSSARDQYLQAQDWLLRYQEAHELGPAEKAMLRNGWFAAASLLFELGQHEAALKTCTTAVSRYRNSPEALEAYLQIARICRAANRPADARAAVEQAKVVLKRIKPEASFQETTNYSRAQWTELLESW